ncbi:helix-turn-helix domain-containing protein [Maricaulis sp.]|uniref:helix-turn-helix domain-containing protein n=1 Tax=Maricaulis sp. TaxID=1486257 RepID=UPI003A8FD436
MSFGPKHFANWRKHCKLTQSQAAELTGISQGHLSDLERGRRRYNEGHLEMMAKAYNCELWELIGRNPEITRQFRGVLEWLESENGGSDTGITEILNVWRHIPADDRRTALRMLRALADNV